MRVLLVTHGYPPRVGGVERVSEQTALGLTAAGHEATVLTRRETAAPALPTLQRTRRNGIEILLVAGGGATHGRFPFFAERVERLFERTLLELEPDVVLIGHLMGHTPSYVGVARRWGIPVVIELHDFYMACERAHLERISGELCEGPDGGRACGTHCFQHDAKAMPRWALRTAMFRAALEQADALICPSAFVASYFQRHFGGRMAQLHVIGNGVGIGGGSTVPPAPSGRLRLATIGVLMPHKGAHIVIEALRLAQLPAARLTLLGVPTSPYLGRLLRAGTAVPNLELRAYGGFEPSELPGLLDGVDAVVVPSLVWESYSIAAREALACGIPVIASRLGALPEAVRNGDNGLLFTPGRAPELAAILQTMVADRRLVTRLRAGIRPTDWITMPERITRLEAVLATAVSAEPRVVSLPSEFDELALLRDTLFEPAV